MRKSLSGSAVSQWQQLMAEWDAVSAEYDSARNRAQEPTIDDVQRATLLSEAERALTRLRELKASIDELVSKGAAGRPVPDGQLTVATIELGRSMHETSSKPKRRMP